MRRSLHLFKFDLFLVVQKVSDEHATLSISVISLLISALVTPSVLFASVELA